MTRKIREAIWIRKKSPPVMNRDEGFHYISHVLDPVIVDQDSRNLSGMSIVYFLVLKNEHFPTVYIFYNMCIIVSIYKATNPLCVMWKYAPSCNVRGV